MSRTQRIRRRRVHRGRPRNKALLGVLVVLVLVGVAGLSAVGYVVSIAASAPSLSSLKARDPGSNSEVLAADGSRLGFIQASELRLPAEGNEFPKILKDATVAIEDRRFYSHKGVDYEGIIRAGVQNLASQKTVQGGSTITMQLARNLYISNERTYERKIREAKVAEEIENSHSKQWILAKYLNTVPYGTVGGQSAIGAKAAARIYFNKRLGELNLREAALLAGLPQAPSLYSPLRSPGAAKARRNDVLREMVKSKMITPEKAEATMRRGLGLDPSTYFTRRRESYFFDFVKDELIKEYGAKTVRLGGLEVRTTVDLKKQQEARAAIDEKLGDIGPSSAIVTINPRNGYITAMASSADYGESKFNLAAQGHRQPGSTFKVMALMAALRAGVDPDSTHYTSRSPFMTEDPAYGHIDVSTYDGSSRGNISLRQATLASDNSVYIQLALDLGPDKVKQAAWDLGIRSKLNGYPAETLGGLEDGVSPLEMANAYATIASGGFRNRPTAITRVTFPDGHKELPARWKVRRTQGVRGRRDREGDRDPRAEHPQGHGREGRHRLPGGGQDRHDGRVHRRVVRRLHAAPGHGGVGRLPGRARADDHALLRGPSGRRLVPGGDLGRVHEAGQGRVLRRLQAAQDAVQLLAVLRPGTRGPAAARVRRSPPRTPPSSRSGARRRSEKPERRPGARTAATVASTRSSTRRRRSPRLRPRPPAATTAPATPPEAPRHRAPLRRPRPSRRRSGWYNPPRQSPVRAARSMREGSARQHHLAHRDPQ